MTLAEVGRLEDGYNIFDKSTKKTFEYKKSKDRYVIEASPERFEVIGNNGSCAYDKDEDDFA